MLYCRAMESNGSVQDLNTSIQNAEVGEQEESADSDRWEALLLAAL